MKVLLRVKKEEEIHVDDITECHIICAIINKHPCLLTKGYNESKNSVSFKCIDERFVEGHAYGVTPNGVINTTIDQLKKNSKIEVFHQKDWKDALQWLIDNGG